jgi:hypothetical protein
MQINSFTVENNVGAIGRALNKYYGELREENKYYYDTLGEKQVLDELAFGRQVFLKQSLCFVTRSDQTWLKKGRPGNSDAESLPYVQPKM